MSPLDIANNLLLIVLGLVSLCYCLVEPLDDDSGLSSRLFVVEGKVEISDRLMHPEHWQRDTRILLNYGDYFTLVKKDGSFRIHVPSGSYIVEVANKDFIFDPVRVDVNSRGKVRTRKLQLLQPSAVSTLRYPIHFSAKSPAKYFQARETWRVTDFLFSPMVIMMVLPLLLIMVLPKLIDTADPEVQREMQQSLQMPKYDLPELSEVMATWFGGAKKPKAKSTKKK